MLFSVNEYFFLKDSVSPWTNLDFWGAFQAKVLRNSTGADCLRKTTKLSLADYITE